MHVTPLPLLYDANARMTRASLLEIEGGNVLQGVAELMHWLEAVGVSGPVFNVLKLRIEDRTLLKQPTLSIAKANFASLRDVLHMSQQQVCMPRLLSSVDCAAACMSFVLKACTRSGTSCWL